MSATNSWKPLLRSHYSPPCYQAVGPAQKLVDALVQTTIREPQLGRGCRQQRSGGSEEREVRGGSWPSPQGPPAHLLWGQQVSWGSREQAGGRCPAGPWRPQQGCPHWLGPGFEAAVNLSPIHPCLCDHLPGSPSMGPGLSTLGGLRSLRASWVGHLAPSAMTTGQGLGTWP